MDVWCERGSGVKDTTELLALIGLKASSVVVNWVP